MLRNARAIRGRCGTKAVVAAYLWVGASMVSPLPGAAQQPSPRAGVRTLKGDQCPAGPKLAYYHQQCFESEYGWLFTTDTARAAEAVAAVQAAARKFEAVFGVKVGRGAVLLREVGVYEIKDPKTGATVRVRAQVWTPEGETETRVAGAAWLFQWDPTESANNSRVDFLSTLRHELGHTLVGRIYESARRRGDGDNYGTAASDWLDEAAAMIAGGLTGQKGPHRELLTFYQGDQAGASPRLIKPLAMFFAMRHPMAQDTGDVLRSIKRNVTRISAAGGAFYAQVRGVIDFLSQEAGDSTVFGAIAVADAQGMSMDQWLAAHGGRYGLPATVAELDTKWWRWLAQAATAVAPPPQRP